jgi:hypothetical protein
MPIKLVPLFEKTLRRDKRPVGKSWRMNETDMGPSAISLVTKNCPLRNASEAYINTRILDKIPQGDHMLGSVPGRFLAPVWRTSGPPFGEVAAGSHSFGYRDSSRRSKKMSRFPVTTVALLRRRFQG